MASSSKPCAASVLVLLLAVAVAMAADTAKKSIASEKSIFPRPSGAIFPRPAAKGSIASEPTIPRPAAQDVSSTCIGSLLELSPCLAFFRDAGTSKAPAGCCKGLGTIVHDQPACLCHIFNHTLERAIGVDIPVNRALTLIRGVCGLTLPQDLMASCANGRAVPPLYVCPAPSA